MTVEIHEGLESVSADIRELWASLVSTGGYNPSLHPNWLGATLTSWGVGRSTDVAVIRRADSVAVIPFLVRRRTIMGVPLRALELASNVFCYHAEIVSDGFTPSELGTSDASVM